MQLTPSSSPPPRLKILGLLALLLAAKNVSPGGTSAPQRQKFHTDDVKSVQNLVSRSDWSIQQLYCFTYCLRVTDKRPQRSNVNRVVNVMNVLQNSQYSWNNYYYILLQKKHLSFAGTCSQQNTKLYRDRPGET